MDIAIKFDDQTGFNMQEIGNERPDGYLTTEFQPFELPVSQLEPEPPLGGCFPVPTENPRSLHSPLRSAKKMGQHGAGV